VLDPPIHVADAIPAALGECPLWSSSEKMLYWVDIEGRRVRRFNPSTGVGEHRVVPGRPGSLALTDRPGELILAMENEVVRFDWSSGSTAPWLTLEPAATGNRLNDGRTDSVGRFWVGSMFERPAAARSTGMLHCVDIDGTSQTVRRSIGISNGIAFDPARHRMYFADTLCDTVWSYRYDAATGEATDESVFIDFSTLPGRPDGACVDSEGGYWVAAVYGAALLRFTPDGSLDRRIDLPVAAPSMPAFGGAELDVLFVTSIGSGASRRLPASELEPGVLLAIESGTRGVAEVPVSASPSV